MERLPVTTARNERLDGINAAQLGQSCLRCAQTHTKAAVEFQGASDIISRKTKQPAVGGLDTAMN